MNFTDDWNKKFNDWKNRHPREQRNKHKVKSPSEAHKLSAQQQKEPEPHPMVTKVLIALAFILPVLILLYALYINFLPFGYENNYELSINEEGIISPLSEEIYITDNKGKRILSLPEGITDQMNVVIDPNVQLKYSTLDVKLEGDEGISIAMPITDEIYKINWDYSWDFTQGIPEELEGNAEHSQEKACTYFSAVNEQTLSLPNSQDLFEEGPMSIYVSWKPSETSRILGDRQQILGHYNWEIYQESSAVRFQVGRMNNDSGPFYSISHSITPDFFEKEHTLLATYNSDPENGQGYIELYIDGKFVQRASISSDQIWTDYNSEKPLSLGWSSHNYATQPHFDGCVYQAKISSELIKENSKFATLLQEGIPISIPIVGSGKINNIKITVSK